MELIHVVIPVYNALPFLRETVASVLDQPFQGIHIILVDDGSADGSGALCDELSTRNKRISVIHQENSGVSAARNAGIAYALERGTSEDYIAFLDADDFWLPNALTEEIVNRIKRGKQDMYVFGSARCDSSAKQFSNPCIYQERCCEGGDGAIWSIQSHFGSVLYSAQMIRSWNIRFMNGLKYSEDKIFLMQSTFLAKHVQFLKRLLHVYRDNRDSAMKKLPSIHPIRYYLPIINGWIASDDFINNWENLSGKHITAGRVLAGIYFMDMAAEHYMRWGKKKDLDQIFAQHPHFNLFVKMKPFEVSTKQFKNHELLLKHPLLYKWKYNLIGVGWFAARLLLRNRWVFQFRQHRKYPLVEMPINR